MTDLNALVSEKTLKVGVCATKTVRTLRPYVRAKKILSISSDFFERKRDQCCQVMGCEN